MSAASDPSRTAGVEAEEAAGKKTPAPRTQNFNEWEDVTLGRSFSNASCDPILGNNIDLRIRREPDCSTR